MSTTATIVRNAVPEDVPQLLELVREYWDFEGIAGFAADRVGAALRLLLANSRMGCGWVAIADARAVGYLLASLVFSLEHGGIMAEIDEFYVAPQLRGQGAGRALLHEAEATLRAAGLVRLQLQLGMSNAAGRRFYAARGFAPRAGYELWDKPLQPVTSTGAG